MLDVSSENSVLEYFRVIQVKLNGKQLLTLFSKLMQFMGFHFNDLFETTFQLFVSFFTASFCDCFSGLTLVLNGIFEDFCHTEQRALHKSFPVCLNIL